MHFQRLANPRVRAGHRHRDPRPVANMAPCRREHFNRDRSGTLEYRRQVTDHATGPLGQSQLDRPIQILDGIIEPTRNLNDHHLTYGACSEPHPPTCSRTAS
jgi:hypothetical protein